MTAITTSPTKAAPYWGRTLLVLCISLPLGLAGYFITNALLADASTTVGDWANVWTTLALYPIMLLVLIAALHREGKTLKDLLNHGSKPLGKEILLGIGIAILAPIVNAIVGFPLNFLIYTPEQIQQFSESMQSGGIAVATMPIWFYLFSLLIQPLAAGIIEELVYRGYALPRLAALTGKKWLAVFISALIYGLQHWAVTPMDWQFGLVRMIGLFAVGVVFGIIYFRQQRLLPLIIGHVLWDFLLIGLPALMGLLSK